MRRNPPLLAFFLALSLALAACGGKDQQTLPASSEPAATAAAALPVSNDSAAPPESIAWLKANAVPFTTSKAGSGFSDLQPLKKIIGDARIVALGEATHGTREFFEMKHRLLEFLVTEMGFNTFAIEATWPEANLVNDYVMTGQGDAKQLLAGLYFWTWNTEEVLDMIEWMRQHNENPGNAPKVSFYGFDMQSPGMAIENVLAFLGRVDPAAREVAEQRYTCFTVEPAGYQSYASRTSIERAACHNALQASFWDLESSQGEYEEKTSASEFARALQSARVVLQGERMYAAGTSPAGFQARDQAMADNVTWLLDQAGPGAKIVLWAHNGHVATKPASMGTYLRAKYGDQMVTVGFDFYQGSFRAVDWTPAGTGTGRGVVEHSVGAPPRDSYEAFFRTAGLPRMIVDLRAFKPVSKQPLTVSTWFSLPHPERTIGAVFADDAPQRFFYQARLPTEFDVIVYFESTTSSIPVR